MPLSKTPRQTPFPERSTGQESPSVSRFSSMTTPAQLKARRLFGIPLKSSLTGETISDETLQFYINSAISELEMTLDLYITPVKFYERYDYKRHEFTWNYNYLKLDHPNVLEVSKVELSFTNDAAAPGFVQFPLEHVHLMPTEGVIQLVPAFGTSLSGFLLSAFSGTQFHALRAIGVSDFPGAVRVEYTCGFEENKIPYAIVEIVELGAAIEALSMMGPILFPQNSTSIGIDGTSQSVGTMGPKFFNDRISQLQEEYNKKLEAVKGYFQRRFLVDFF